MTTWFMDVPNGSERPQHPERGEGGVNRADLAALGTDHVVSDIITSPIICLEQLRNTKQYIKMTAVTPK